MFTNFIITLFYTNQYLDQKYSMSFTLLCIKQNVILNIVPFHDFFALNINSFILLQSAQDKIRTYNLSIFRAPLGQLSFSGFFFYYYLSVASKKKHHKCASVRLSL